MRNRTVQGRFRLNPPQMLAVGYLTLILLGALLLMLPVATRPGHRLHFIDALFEATSAVSVTGLVVVDTATTFTVFGQLVLLFLIQIGGLGYMTFGIFIAVLLGKQIGLKERLMLQNALNQNSLRGLVRLVKWIVFSTLVIEMLGALVLWLRWSSEMGWGAALYAGIFHAVSAFNNAGFDIMGDFRSLTGYVGDPVVNLVVTALIILGGIGFTVILDLTRKRGVRRLSLHSKIVLLSTLILNAAAILLLYLLETGNPHTLGSLHGAERFWAAYFQGIAPRTAGFNTIDLSQMTNEGKTLIMALMFIGAAPGSTGGGIKITTFVLLLLTAWSVIANRDDINVLERRIAPNSIMRALTIFLISIAIIFLGFFLLNLTEEASMEAILFETVSAFGTVGLTLGLTPHLTLWGKLIIIAVMYIGKLGTLTIAFALANRGKERSALRYPEEKIMIG
ncbi:TrkH family potassium uptake protein [Bacillaceae bacterium]